MLPSMKPRFLKSSSGMTLLEVLVTMLLIGSALGMSLSMIQSSLQFERNALRTGIFINALDEIGALARSNKLCAPSYAFSGFTLDGNGRANPKWTTTSCTANYNSAITYNAKNLIQLSHERAQTDVINWLTDLTQHFPQGDEQRRNTKIVYHADERSISIELPYLNIVETAALAEGDVTNIEEFTFKQKLQL
ncbi:MAG: prepilin-type N-terminal cleavage/methylation domain-containing protein [Cardiobacteriaceae bacterium]|nr:prepilin-type N-terminal cleavage/methylation domain-containing protein [Cardiobacteriaceae bacterium]